MAIQPDDVAAIAQHMNADLDGSGLRALNAIERNVEPGEQLLRIVAGVRGAGILNNVKGLLVLTDHRVFFLHADMVRSSKESTLVEVIAGVAVTEGRRWSTITTTGTRINQVVSRVNKVDAEAFADDLRSLLTNRAGSTTRL
jgi:hypothetical protein